jgi:hypothetical protein
MTDLFSDLKPTPSGLTTVVNLRTDGFDTYVGRAGHGYDGYFGNPYRVEEYGSQAISLFRAYFLKRVDSDPDFRSKVLALQGKRLGCFCAPSRCHADVIAEWVNLQWRLNRWSNP